MWIADAMRSIVLIAIPAAAEANHTHGDNYWFGYIMHTPLQTGRTRWI